MLPHQIPLFRVVQYFIARIQANFQPFFFYNPVSKGNYSVCISIKEGASSSDYKLQSRLAKPWCGFAGDPAELNTPTIDYNIKTAARKYATIGQLIINEEKFFNSLEK